MEAKIAISRDQDETIRAIDNIYSGVVLRPESKNINSLLLTIFLCLSTGNPVSVAQQDE